MLRPLFISITSLLLIAACAAKQPDTAAVEEQFYGDHVISQDTTWTGTVVIDGVVVVGRKATLTIKPGTVIRFRKVDRNNDGIGDSEIRVLGRIIAEGLPASPILFESAEPDPRPKDWSYLLIFTSGKKSTIAFCRFRHAFSGVQVHFSTADITNSLFINNNEGLRFGRARLTLAGNRFSHNDIGVRFTRMEGPVAITGNEISENRIGVFLVPSGQNIQDFFEPDRSGRPWNTGKLLITENNIYNNTWYNLSLGAKQLWDLDVAGNWWGSAKPDLIHQKIYDRNSDPELGRALFMPYAEKRFDVGGMK